MEKHAKIYVAGHGGMAGSAIVKQLKEQGYENIIVRSHAELDLENWSDTLSFFKQERPEYVFFAAGLVGGIEFKREYPLDMLNCNLRMTMNVLEAACRCQVKGFLNIGSILLYPQSDCEIFREEDIGRIDLQGIDAPYTLAKLTGAKLCEYYRQQHGFMAMTVIPCNFFGEHAPMGSNKAGVIPALIERFHRAKEHHDSQVVVWGTGNACREFLYSQDLAEACIFVMNHAKDEFIFNVGSGGEITIREAAMTIKEVVDYPGEVVFDSDKPEGRQHMCLNSQRIHDLGWYAGTSFEEAVRNTYQWWLAEERF